MKVRQEQKITNQFYGTGHSEQMKLDHNSLAHIMTVLTALYADSELAVIREYSTNAWDSMVAAGRKDIPIHITLPDVFSPQFKVKDTGTGLSEEEVFNVFGVYGASTKRDSDDYTGQLGLGCKSALAYTNQFSLTAIKSGMKRVFSVHLDEFGVGKITKLSESATNEHNGVEISIPVKTAGTFVQKARDFYYYATSPVTFNVDGFLGNTKREKISLSDDMELVKGVQRDIVIMGNVPYPIDHKMVSVSHKPTFFNNSGLVIYVGMGDVAFTPSREALQYTEVTKKFLAKKFKEADTLFHKSVQRDLDTKKSFFEALDFLTSMRSVRAFSQDFVWKGKTLTNLSSFGSLKTDLATYAEGILFQRDYYGNGTFSEKSGATVLDIKEDALIITDPFTKYLKGRARILALNENRKSIFFMVKIDDEVLSSLKNASILTADELKKAVSGLKLPPQYARNPGGANDVEGRFIPVTGYQNKYGGGGIVPKYQYAGKVNKAKKTLIYGSKDEYEKRTDLGPVLFHFYPSAEASFYAVPPGRLANFLKHNPNAITLEEAWKKVNKVFDDDIVSKAAASKIGTIMNEGRILDLGLHYKPTGIKDIDQYLKFVSQYYGSSTRSDLLASSLTKLSPEYVRLVEDKVKWFKTMQEEMKKKYPLLFVRKEEDFWRNYVRERDEEKK